MRNASFASDRRAVYDKFKEYYDEATYPRTPDEDLLPLEVFTRDFWSKDKPVEKEYLEDIAKENAG